jgi:hypothetical protein
VIVAANVVVIVEMRGTNSFVRDGAVRGEQNEDVAVVRHVRCVRAEARLAAEGNATEPAKREGRTEVVVEDVSQVTEFVINLIRAD